jgi:hypothetical protein
MPNIQMPCCQGASVVAPRATMMMTMRPVRNGLAMPPVDQTSKPPSVQMKVKMPTSVSKSCRGEGSGGRRRRKSTSRVASVPTRRMARTLRALLPGVRPITHQSATIVPNHRGDADAHHLLETAHGGRVLGAPEHAPALQSKMWRP